MLVVEIKGENMANIYYKLNDYIPLTSIYDLSVNYSYYTYNESTNTYTPISNRIFIYDREEGGTYTGAY
jgi:hypothetical protein